MILRSEKKHAPTGVITVRSEEMAGSNLTLKFKISCKDVDKKDLFSSDPFLVFNKQLGESWVQTTKSETIKSTCNPEFNPQKLSLAQLNNGNLETPIQIVCYDWDSDGNHDLIGSCLITFKDVAHGSTFELINEKKQAKKGPKYKNSGVLLFEKFEIVKEVSFLEYLQGGAEIALSVAVDYTQSYVLIGRIASLRSTSNLA